jgi:hypothetical protein
MLQTQKGLAFVLYFFTFISCLKCSPVVLTCSDPTEKMHEAQAVEYLLKIGNIRISSSGACSDRSHPRCTSLDQVNCHTVAQIINYRQNSGCHTIITGYSSI